MVARDRAAQLSVSPMPPSTREVFDEKTATNMADLEGRFTEIRAAGEREINGWKAAQRAARQLEDARSCIQGCSQMAAHSKLRSWAKIA